MNLVVPCALIACMIFLVFVLPPKSGERISLGITVMLSMAIFQELSSEKLPSSSDNYPLLGKNLILSVVTFSVTRNSIKIQLNSWKKSLFSAMLKIKKAIPSQLSKNIKNGERGDIHKLLSLDSVIDRRQTIPQLKK